MVPDPLGVLLHNKIDPTVYNVPVNGTPYYPSYSFADWLFTTKPGLYGIIHGIANPTGVALMIVLTIMVISSMKWVRKGGYFEVSQTGLKSEAILSNARSSPPAAASSLPPPVPPI